MAQHVRGARAAPRSQPRDRPVREGLILRLMAKEPDDRPASGRGVAAALRRGDLRITTLTRPDELPAADPELGGGSRPTRRRRLAPGHGRDAHDRRAVHRSSAARKLGVVGRRSPAACGATPELVREMLAEVVLAEPITLSPDEGYLGGRYLAYLLGGARRRGPLSAASSTRETPTAPAAPGADGGPGRQPRGIGDRAAIARAVSSSRCATRSVPCSSRWS